jgi:L-ascorbate metabolism protein UlaG (beta-lactamase superfamily)
LEVTSLGHSGIRIKHNDFLTVVDPGAGSVADSLVGADALLITHEHVDHYDITKIKAALAVRPRLPIYTNKSVAALLEGSGARVRVIGHGEAFELAGLPVHCYGEWHAVLHPDLPKVRNTGFLFDHKLFHAGDAYTDPGVPIDVLLAPLDALWSKDAITVDYIRHLKPRLACPVHDASLTDLGKEAKGLFLAKTGPPGPGTGVDYFRLPTVGSFTI